MQAGLRWESRPHDGHSSINMLLEGHSFEMLALWEWAQSVDWENDYRSVAPGFEMLRDPSSYRIRLDPAHLVILYQDITEAVITQERLRGFLQLTTAINTAADQLQKAAGYEHWVKACETEAARVRSRYHA